MARDQALPESERRPWRKHGLNGATRCNSCLPASPTRWAWAMCGASHTCVRCTAEVSAGTQDAAGAWTPGGGGVQSRAPQLRAAFCPERPAQGGSA